MIHDRENIMKKKIIVVLAFCTLILATAIVFIVLAIDTYRMEMNDPSIDILEGLGACIVVVIGGFIVFYECDLFYTFAGKREKSKLCLSFLQMSPCS